MTIAMLMNNTVNAYERAVDDAHKAAAARA
jgi:5,10-methylene-tetrahydrofolate dehydrogenase/methenyl tetrahydrofolate cyclohydrolase